MDRSRINLLIVEDMEDDALLMVDVLREGRFDPVWRRVDSAVGLTSALGDEVWSIVLADYSLPGFDGRRALQIVRESGVDTPVVIVSGSIGEENTVELLMSGAADCVLKTNLARLPPVVTRVLQDADTRRERSRAERQLQHLLNSAPMVLYSTSPDLDGAQPASLVGSVERLTGYSAEEALMPGWSVDNVHPDDRRAVLELAKALAERHHFQHEYRFRRKDGRYIWIHDELVGFYDQAGAMKEIVGVWTDVTTRKEAERALRASNRALRMLSEVNQAVVHASSENDLLRRVCEILAGVGGRPLAWVGMARHDEPKTVEPIASAGAARGYLDHLALSWADIDLGAAPVSRAIRSGQAVIASDLETEPGFEPWRQLARDHGLRSSVAVPLRSEGGEVFAAVAIYASESSAFFPEEVKVLEDLATSLTTGLDFIRARSARDGFFRELGEKTARLGILNFIATKRFADVPVEALVRACVDRIAAEFPEVRVAYAAVDRQNVVTFERSLQPSGMSSLGGLVTHLSSLSEHLGVVLDLESVVAPDLEVGSLDEPVRIHLHEGSAHAALHVPVRDSVDSVVGLLALHAREARRWSDHEMRTLWEVAQHLSNALREANLERERKAAELRFQQAQRMESIGRLAGGVAHDFNNLLSVIKSNAEFALDALAQDDPVGDDIREIRKAGDRAADLTRQLLAFGRRQILKPTVLDVNRVLADMERMLRRVLGENIDLVIVKADVPHRVLADPGQLEQILMNLVVNARDAMPDGGKLTIELANAELDQDCSRSQPPMADRSYLRLSVTDTGTGMSQEARERCFEPFFTTKEHGKGTGLGLATVYGIVKQSGGFIWVCSELGAGTTFQIYLPRHAGDADSILPPSSRKLVAASDGETVLVAEDEEGVRAAVQRVLQQAGYSVLAAANGEDALRLFQVHQGTIHLLVTDVVMPGMTGRALADELAQLAPGIKVLYMSGYTDNAIVHHGVLDTRMRFIPKPFSNAELTAMVREVLDEG